MPIFVKKKTAQEKSSLSSSVSLPNDVLWLDLLNLTEAEEHKLEAELKIDIPTFRETKGIPISNRLYENNHTTYVTISLYINNNHNIHKLNLHTLTFILKKDMLITMREGLDQFFDIDSHSIETKYNLIDKIYLKIFFLILENLINNTAAVLEKITHHLNEQSKKLIEAKEIHNIVFKELLVDIANIGNSITLIQESLISFIRMIDFLSKTDHIIDPNNSFINYIKVFARDLGALKDQATFLSGKVNFLLDATLGLINIEQNKIIKLFSVISVIFTPPIFVASIYGMNFEIMPELQWELGYGWALGLMYVSAWLPYKYFKKRGWF